MTMSAPRTASIVSGGSDFDDRLLQVSAGVELGNGWAADAGYKYNIEGDVDNHTAGFLLARSFSFGQPDK